MASAIDAKLRSLQKCRTLTYFLPQAPAVDEWAGVLQHAAEFLHLAKRRFEDRGAPPGPRHQFCRRPARPTRAAHSPRPPSCREVS